MRVSDVFQQAPNTAVQPTWGTHRVIWSFFSAGSFSRFDGESTLPPQAATPAVDTVEKVGKLTTKSMGLCSL
jgi:hypothetical protein